MNNELIDKKLEALSEQIIRESTEDFKILKEELLASKDPLSREKKKDVINAIDSNGSSDSIEARKVNNANSKYIHTHNKLKKAEKDKNTIEKSLSSPAVKADVKKKLLARKKQLSPEIDNLKIENGKDFRNKVQANALSLKDHKTTDALTGIKEAEEFDGEKIADIIEREQKPLGDKDQDKQASTAKENEIEQKDRLIDQKKKEIEKLQDQKEKLTEEIEQLNEAKYATARDLAFGGEVGKIIDYVVNGTIYAEEPKLAIIGDKLKKSPVFRNLLFKYKRELNRVNPDRAVLTQLKFKIKSEVTKCKKNN